MAYLHCHACGWSQDDFWSGTGWNPEKSMDGQWDLAFCDKVYLDHNFFEEAGLQDKMHEDEGGLWISGPDLLAHELRQCASSVEGMVVRTYEEWEKVRPTFQCPECGSNNWDID
jgi:hypothetical protein